MPIYYFYALVDASLDLSFGLTIYYQEHLIVNFVLAWAIVGQLNMLLQVQVTYGGQLEARWLTADMILLCIWGILQTLRMIARLRARRIVAHDVKLYDDAWTRITVQEGNTALAQLQDLVDKIAEKGGNNSHQHTRSLDSLYKEAFTIHHVFRKIVQGKALVSNGFFLAQSRVVGERETNESPLDIEHGSLGCAQARDIAVEVNTVIRWRDAQSPDGEGLVKWTTIKSVDRAFEKIYRSYNFDTRLLVDVVREAIAFEKFSDLIQCFASLAQDPSIRIVRIKNRLTKRYDKWKCGGYRSLLVNLQIDNPDTNELRVKDHVCELQLTLIPFMLLRNREAHERYKVNAEPTALSIP